jgi:hypothetical protein
MSNVADKCVASEANIYLKQVDCIIHNQVRRDHFKI